MAISKGMKARVTVEMLDTEDVTNVPLVLEFCQLYIEQTRDVFRSCVDGKMVYTPSSEIFVKLSGTLTSESLESDD